MAPDARQTRRITILGSTGSIGTSTLDVVCQLGGRERYEVVALTGNGNVDLLAAQAKECGARLVVTLINALRQRGGKRGVASLCIGGGEATAMAIELP